MVGQQNERVVGITSHAYQIVLLMATSWCKQRSIFNSVTKVKLYLFIPVFVPDHSSYMCWNRLLFSIGFIFMWLALARKIFFFNSNRTSFNIKATLDYHVCFKLWKKKQTKKKTKNTKTNIKVGFLKSFFLLMASWNSGSAIKVLFDSPPRKEDKK